MKGNLITLLVALAGLLAAWWTRGIALEEASPQVRYYWSAVTTVSAILVVITALRCLRWGLKPPQPVVARAGKPASGPRGAYRLPVEKPLGAVFVQKADDNRSAPVFSCPVEDISETGIRLACQGIYAIGQPVVGEIIFQSGRSAPINGLVIRKTEAHTCLSLHCTIDPSLLMAEQRERIQMKKDLGPLPTVSRNLLEPLPRGLPSHTPKGICRIKGS